MTDLVLYDLHPSPNNVKARLALGFKGLRYEKRAVDPRDRSELVALSGQPLTPVLRHGDAILFDSSAILRYLDANVAREPRLFASDDGRMRAIERWEMRTRGGDFGQPVGMCFDQFFAPARDAAVLREAGKIFERRCQEIEAALSPAGFLVGDAASAADLCIVPLLNYGCASEAFVRGPQTVVTAFLAEHLRIPASTPRTREYVQRIMALDR